MSRAAPWDGQGDNVVIESPSVGAAAPRPWRRMSGQSCLGARGHGSAQARIVGSRGWGAQRCSLGSAVPRLSPEVGSPLGRSPKAPCVTRDAALGSPGLLSRQDVTSQPFRAPAPVSAPQAGKTPCPLGEATPRTWAGVTAQGGFVLDLVHLTGSSRVGSADVLEVTPLYHSSVAAIKPREWL